MERSMDAELGSKRDARMEAAKEAALNYLA